MCVCVCVCVCVRVCVRARARARELAQQLCELFQILADGCPVMCAVSDIKDLS